MEDSRRESGKVFQRVVGRRGPELGRCNAMPMKLRTESSGILGNPLESRRRSRAKLTSPATVEQTVSALDLHGASIASFSLVEVARHRRDPATGIVHVLDGRVSLGMRIATYHKKANKRTPTDAECKKLGILCLLAVPGPEASGNSGVRDPTSRSARNLV